MVCAMLNDGRVVDDFLCTDVYGHNSKPPAYDLCFNQCELSSVSYILLAEKVHY